MARRNTSTKSATSEKVETPIVEAPIKKEVVKEETKKTFNDNDYIMCRSITIGKLYVDCKNGNFYEFDDYNSECEILYRDLVNMVRQRSTHIYKPTFIILDEDFVSEFPQLQKTYDNMFTTKDLKDILRNSNITEMKQQIESLPENVRKNLRTIAASMVSSREIDSVRKIEALTQIFGTNFNLISTLFCED